MFTCNTILGCYGNFKPNKKTDSGTVVIERTTLIWSKFCIVINFLELTCLLGSIVKGSFWFQTSKLMNKSHFKFLFTGIKMRICTLFTFKNEV